MTRNTLALLPALALSLGCKKPPPQQAAEATARPAASAPAAEAPAAAPADEPKPLEITEPLVAKYVVYEKEYLEVFKAAMAELGEGYKRAEKQEGLRQTVGALATNEKAMRIHEEGRKRALLKAGLSAADEEQLGKAVGEVITSRLVWKKGGGEAQVAEMEKQMKAALANAPPEAKAEAAEQLKQMRAGLESLRDATETRAQYGNKAVDAILQHETELATLHEQVFAMGGGK